jgi:hypothetical protein
MNLGPKRRQRLQLEIVDVDSELERLTILLLLLHPDIAPIIDRARDLLGRCSHLIYGDGDDGGGVDLTEFCDSDRENVRVEEVEA